MIVSMPVRNMIHASRTAKPTSPICCKSETVERDRSSAGGRRNSTLNHKKPASQVATTLTTTGITYVLMMPMSSNATPAAACYASGTSLERDFSIGRLMTRDTKTAAMTPHTEATAASATAPAR